MKHPIINTLLGPGQSLITAILNYHSDGGKGSAGTPVPQKPKPVPQHWARVKQLEYYSNKNDSQKL